MNEPPVTAEPREPGEEREALAPTTAKQFVDLVRSETNERYPDTSTVEQDRLRGAFQQGFTRGWFLLRAALRDSGEQP